MGKVAVGFFSFTEITDPSQHRAYNEWHQLDHLPEQLPIPGVVHGQRWVSTPTCRRARAVDGERLAAVHYVTLYLMAEPVTATLQEFLATAQRLRGLGRFHLHRRALLSGPFRFLEAAAAPRVLVSPEAVPYRPGTGVYVIVEDDTGSGSAHAEQVDAWVRRQHVEGIPALLNVPGVAGVWSFVTDARLPTMDAWDPGNQRVTVCYLDGDPLAVADALAPLLQARWQDAPVMPVFAGPLETIVPWQWDWFDEA